MSHSNLIFKQSEIEPSKFIPHLIANELQATTEMNDLFWVFSTVL